MGIRSCRIDLTNARRGTVLASMFLLSAVATCDTGEKPTQPEIPVQPGSEGMTGMEGAQGNSGPTTPQENQATPLPSESLSTFQAGQTVQLAPEKGGLKFTVVVPQVGGVETLNLSTVKVSLKYSRSGGEEEVKIFDGDVTVSLKEQKPAGAKLIQAGTIVPGAIEELRIAVGSASVTWAAAVGNMRTASLLVSQGGQFVLRSSGNVPVPQGRDTILEVQVGIHCPVSEAGGAVPALLLAGRSFLETGGGPPAQTASVSPEWTLAVTDSGQGLDMAPSEASREACSRLLAPDSVPPVCKINSPVSGTQVPTEVTIEFQCVDPEPSYGLDRQGLSLVLDGRSIEFNQSWTVWVDKRDQDIQVPIVVDGQTVLSLSAGPHDVSVLVKDRVGNSSESARSSFTIASPTSAAPEISKSCTVNDFFPDIPGDNGQSTKFLVTAKISALRSLKDVTLSIVGGGSWKMTVKPPSQYRAVLQAKDVAGHTLQITAEDVAGQVSRLIFQPGTDVLYKDVYPDWIVMGWDPASGSFKLVDPNEVGESARMLHTEFCTEPDETEPGFRTSDLPAGCWTSEYECLGTIYTYYP